MTRGKQPTWHLGIYTITSICFYYQLLQQESLLELSAQQMISGHLNIPASLLDLVVQGRLKKTEIHNEKKKLAFISFLF